MINKQTIAELEDILNSGIDASMFPYTKGNSTRIGRMVVRKSKTGYHIYDTDLNKKIGTTFSKTAAFALARSCSKNKNLERKIFELDRIIQKNYIDCLFYKHIIVKTKDEEKKFITRTRFEIAKSRTEDARKKLDSFIFG